MDNSDILTLSQVAVYLKVAEKTVSRMVHRQEIPCVKVGGQWRFMKSVIDEWLLQRMLPTAESGGLSSVVEHQAEILPLSRFVKAEWINLDLQPGAPVEILAQLVAPLKSSGTLNDEQSYLKLLLQREDMMPTAVGQGVALPHVRDPERNPVNGPFVIVGRCDEGAEYDAPDGELVRLFFLIIVRSETGHVRVLAKLAQMLRQSEWRKRFLQASSPEAVIRVFLEAEHAS